MALGGKGFPRGRIAEIYGPEGSGKTTLALHVVAHAQKGGALRTDSEDFSQQVGEMLKMIAATKEYLYA